MERRRFLLSTAMAAATAAAARQTEAEPRTDLSGVSWDKAPCRFCGTGCHVQVGVKGGKVVAIAGDPLAEVFFFGDAMFLERTAEADVGFFPFNFFFGDVSFSSSEFTPLR